MRCLIISKTRAGNAICVGALATNRTNLRLTERPDFPFLPVDTRYEIGQVWEIAYFPCENVNPPHVEDVLVHKARFLYTRPDLATDLPNWVNPWKGNVIEVFGRKTRYTTSGSRYIQDDIPDRSVGFWIPDKDLTYNEPYYRYGRFRMRYVGFAIPPKIIKAGRLVRVSLSRWFKPDDAEGDFPERCYLQLSGVYK